MSEPSRRAGGAEPRKAERDTPAEDARRDDEVDVASEDSFPASDPPAFTPSTIGAPVRAPAPAHPQPCPAAPARGRPAD